MVKSLHTDLKLYFQVSKCSGLSSKSVILDNINSFSKYSLSVAKTVHFHDKIHHGQRGFSVDVRVEEQLLDLIHVHLVNLKTIHDSYSQILE